MTTKAKMPYKLRLKIVDLANKMLATEPLNKADFRKITLREITDAAPTAAQLSSDNITALREDAHATHSVFAKYLNSTAGHLLPMKRGRKRSTGPASAMLM